MERNEGGRAICLKTVGLLPPRFWSKVRKTPRCWLWTGGTSKGYGLFWWSGRTVPAHRLCYESLVGPVPEGCELDHVCRQRACVNPEHLRAVDHRTNVVAGVGRSAINAARVCCQKGHPYTTHTRANGGIQRRCLTCRNERYAEQRKAARAVKWSRLWRRKLPNGCQTTPALKSDQ